MQIQPRTFQSVAPAQAGAQCRLPAKPLGSRLRGNDKEVALTEWYPALSQRLTQLQLRTFRFVAPA